MQAGEVAACGRPQDVMQMPVYETLLQQQQEEQVVAGAQEEAQDGQQQVPVAKTILAKPVSTDATGATADTAGDKADAAATVAAGTTGEKPQGEKTKGGEGEVSKGKADAGEQLYSAENREVGAVSVKTYVAYFSSAAAAAAISMRSRKAKKGAVGKRAATLALEDDYDPEWDRSPRGRLFGALLLTAIVALYVVTQALRTVGDVFLAKWADACAQEQEADNTAAALALSNLIAGNVTVANITAGTASSGGGGTSPTASIVWFYYFVAMGLTVCVLTFISRILFFMACVGASRNFHNAIFSRVLAAPVNLFFDVTPAGTILNRFAKDMDHVDMLLPDFLSQMMMQGWLILATIATCAATNPFFLVAFLPLIVMFFMLMNWFRHTSRELKRLEGISRSPIFASFSETLNGLSSIRAFGSVGRFMKKHDSMVEDNTALYQIYNWTGRWLALRLDLIVSVIIFATAILAVRLRAYLGAGFAGLALAYSLQLTGSMQWAVRVAVETENNMTSVERLNHYRAEIPEERQARAPTDQKKALTAQGKSGGTAVGEDWPAKGEIELRGVRLRYRPGLELVLGKPRQGTEGGDIGAEGLSFRVAAGEKVGICGRTGAGKSSLMVALFRMVELDEGGGSILVDGVDIATVPLQTLRSRLSIIPQDPVLFSGSLRYNLDPFNQFSDEEVWGVLSAARMDTAVRALPEGLLAEVAEKGENFSGGERQLLCVGRVLLRRSKVIVMDEATASVDTGTDARIQQMMRNEFAQMTVLCIAHRLDTIVDADRILVLDNGQLGEYGSPAELMAREGHGMFWQLLHERETNLESKEQSS
jgi:ABC-type multidrug transport system fused ATPase/permease subunit